MVADVVDGHEQLWMDMNSCGWTWMDVDGCGWMRMDVDGHRSWWTWTWMDAGCGGD